jgi:hypothetical protein
MPNHEHVCDAGRGTSPIACAAASVIDAKSPAA